MNKVKIQLSKFDIAMIIAFVSVGLIGAAAWYYLSGALADAQAKCAVVAKDYNACSATKGIIVSLANNKALAANNDLLQTQLDPLIGTYLLAKDNDLDKVQGEDPVAWKHDLDDDVKTLTSEAKNHSIPVPERFYYGFSRYLTESPGDAATGVLTKQRKAIKAIVEILIDSQVNSIKKVQRSYEEDPHGGGTTNGGGGRAEGDQIDGFAVAVPNTYTAYPFAVEFEASPESLRPILDGLIKSPYVFIVRSIEVHNAQLDSPRVDSLAQMAGGNPGSVIASAPGGVAANAPTLGPQFLFGYGPLRVRMRIDMIEWNPALTNVEALTPKKK
jgi:hypothetical protein